MSRRYIENPPPTGQREIVVGVRHFRIHSDALTAPMGRALFVLEHGQPRAFAAQGEIALSVAEREAVARHFGRFN